MAQGPVRNDDPASGAATGAATAKPAGSRRGLFLPYILLAALAPQGVDLLLHALGFRQGLQ